MVETWGCDVRMGQLVNGRMSMCSLCRVGIAIDTSRSDVPTNQCVRGALPGLGGRMNVFLWLLNVFRHLHRKAMSV